MATSTGNLLSRIGRNPLLAFLVFTLLVSLIGFAANSYFVSQYASQDEVYHGYTERIGVLSQEIAKLSGEAASGGEGIQDSLRKSISEFDQNLTALQGGGVFGVIAPPSSVLIDSEDIALSWDAMKEQTLLIVSRQAALKSLSEAISDLTISMTAIQQENNQIVASLLRTSAPAEQVALAQRQSLLVERIVHSVENLLDVGNATPLVANINRDRQMFEEVQNGLTAGNRDLLLTAVADSKARSNLAKIDELYSSASARLDEILPMSIEVLRVKEAAEKVFSGSANLLTQIDDLRAGYENYANSRLVTPLSGLILGMLVFIIILAISVTLFRESMANLEVTAQQNESNQEAILQLLDELADLAEGDLTVQATVTESFTGAIADSINFSIDQMRDLVSQINATSTRVSTAAANTRKSVAELEGASQKQAAEISDVSRSVDEMAISIDRVSYNAAESTSVAERSVEIANNGAQVVQNTIGGMEKIRGQIQETAKRIKRLGESSQEIGDIVNLINDIADQTNILSLNAAIQASMAGDAGRGFAVVADEVQRLAERSGAAAKQIAALVKTIQSDTNEAVISMEQTTTEVVQGARLAHAAGGALDEIESVSKSLAELIENISDAARQQAASAGKISNTMKSIQEITSKTTAGTQDTAVAVGNFAQMTDELRESVSGFKLPK